MLLVTDSNRTAQNGELTNQDEGTNVRLILNGYKGGECDVVGGSE